MDRNTRNTPLMCLVLSLVVIVAMLAAFVNDYDKKLKALDSLSTHLVKRVEILTRENEKLTGIVEGRCYFQYFHYWFGHVQIYFDMFHSFSPPISPFISEIQFNPFGSFLNMRNIHFSDCFKVHVRLYSECENIYICVCIVPSQLLVNVWMQWNIALSYAFYSNEERVTYEEC